MLNCVYVVFRQCIIAVSVAAHHREAGLRRSECEAGLTADSGETPDTFLKKSSVPLIITLS